MTQITIGVLITYYNEKEMLTECINSLLAGNSKPNEILVYDDASQFPAQDYIPVNRMVRVIRGEENRGPAFGRNELMRFSNCDYVHFQDSDDLFCHDWYSKVSYLIETEKPDMVITEIQSINEQGHINSAIMGLAGLSEQNDLLEFAIKGVLLIPSSTFKRELGLKINGLRTRELLPQSEDFDFHVRLVNQVSCFKIISEPLIQQRLRSNSHSSKNLKTCWYSMIKAASLLTEELPAQYHQHLVEIAAKYASILYETGHKEEAHWGFGVAKTIGRPNYIYKNRIYQLVAKTFNPELAEQLAALYRLAFPQKLRKFFKKMSWAK